MKLPPTEFSNAMDKIDRADGLADTWQDTPEWEIYKAGYNAAVDEANARVLAMYAMPNIAERCLEDQQ